MASDSTGPDSRPYYTHHVFFCLNDRGPGVDSCAARGAQAGFQRCKDAVKAAGLWGAGKIRVNKSGCLNRCADGPVVVVYPQAAWYTFFDGEDIDELVQSHLLEGVPVPRLMLETLPPAVE